MDLDLVDLIGPCFLASSIPAASYVLSTPSSSSGFSESREEVLDGYILGLSVPRNLTVSKIYGYRSLCATGRSFSDDSKACH